MKKDFIQFYREHREQYEAVEKSYLREIKDFSRKQYIRGIEEEEDRREVDRERIAVDERISVTQWLKSLEAEQEN